MNVIALVPGGCPFLCAGQHRLTVPCHGGGHHHDARTGEVDAPAEVDLGADGGEGRVEPADRAEEVGAHEKACRRKSEHVLHEVVLFLVDLAVIGERHLHAEPVDGDADALDHARVVPMDELRAHHPGIRPVRLLHHPGHGVGCERDVVMEEAEEPAVALDQVQDRVAGAREARISARVADDGSGKGSLDEVPRGLAGRAGRLPGEEKEVLDSGIVLGGESGHGVGEPVARLMDDHRDHHGWRGGKDRLRHAPARLVAPFRGTSA